MKRILFEIASEVPEDRLKAIKAHLNYVAHEDVNFQGYYFEVARSDFTTVDVSQINGSRGQDLTSLYYEVQRIAAGGEP